MSQKTGFTLKAELHCHANRRFRISYFPFLYDSATPEEDIVDECQKKSISIIAVTDHDSLEGYRNTSRIVAEKNLPILVIPAAEVSTSAGHILAYGITQEIPRKLPAGEAIKRIHAQGGLAFAAHPYNDNFLFGAKIRLSKDIYSLPIDGLEAYNATISAKANAKAAAAAQKMNIPATASSDAHVREEIGRSVTYFPQDTNTVPKFLNCLKKGIFQVSPAYSPWASMVVHYAVDNIQSQLIRGDAFRP